MPTATTTETYQQMRARFQREFDEFPFLFAFSDEQFDSALAERGWKESQLVRVMPGGFVQRNDLKRLHSMINSHDCELRAAMTDYDFAYRAFLDEMSNHEYHLDTWQADWDVCSCFGDAEYIVDKDGPAYLAEMGYADVTQRAYRDARRRFYQLCDENGWW